MPVYTHKDIPKMLPKAESGQAASVYLIFGDPFLGRDLFLQLIDRLLPAAQASLNLEKVDGEREDLSSILERMQTFPLLPGRKVVAVKNPVQIFSVPGDDRLLKQSQEAWEKGETDRSLRILRTLLRNSGIFKDGAPGLDSLENQVKEKWFSGSDTPLPDWCKKALQIIQEGLPEEISTPNLNPGPLFESALRKGFPHGHILVLWMEGPLGNNRVVKLIAELGVVFDLTLKQGKKGEQTFTLKGLLQSRLSKEGKTIHPQAEALLLDRVGGETALLDSEVAKLVAYVGERRQILPEDVLETVAPRREEPIYELTGVLGEKKLGEALKKLKQLEDQGYHPLQIVAALANTLRRLLSARELLETLPPLGLRAWQEYGAFSASVLPRIQGNPLAAPFSQTHPFALFLTLKTARSFSPSHLLRALKALQEADLLLKSGGADPSLLLQDFIILFCRAKAS